MMTPLTVSHADSRDNKFVGNQAESSAQMVSQMVCDEMRRGQFSQLALRVGRIEELVNQGYLKSDTERRLYLLAAQFLEGAGETKRAFRFTGRLVADVDSLPEDIYLELRRFQTRLFLNVGNIEAARTEVSSIERSVLRSDGAFGDKSETVDPDSSRVTLPTWLLTVEVCLAEGNATAAIDGLREAFASIQHHGQSAEDGVMFELLSALACFHSGDDEGVPALAYLYRVHLVLDSGIEAAIRARIAAVCGDLERTSGLSVNEAARWSNYGPGRSMVERYLGEGEGVVPPSDLLRRMLPAAQVGDAVTEVTRITRPFKRQEAAAVLTPSSVPMFFVLGPFVLEEITSMFDQNLKTGPLVIDWSACDKEVVREVISSGAISAIAGKCDRGTIYFNNGAYVDAEFEGIESGDRGASVVETIFELFRISMTGLPAACVYQTVAGPLAARVPEVVNLRPNMVNIELMKRLDHLRSGIPESEDENIDSLFDNWETPEVSRLARGNGSSVISEGLLDSDIGGNEGFVRSLSEMMEAADVSAVSELAGKCLSALGIDDGFVDVRVAGATDSLVESNVKGHGRVVVEECCSGPVVVQLLLEDGHAVNCPDAVKAILHAAAQRLRIMPGAVIAGKIESARFVAADPVSQSMLTILRDLAALDGTSEGRKLKGVCLVGERGVGKEILAGLIHKWSGRAQAPFRVINFGGVSKELAASELFGAKRGAYTGSVNTRTGFIQEAEGGTLFLDELDEASDVVQAHLKRVVEYGTYNTVGDPAEHTCNVRFVAATNVVDIDSSPIKRDLKDRFLVLRVPPLRDRRGDIRPLAENFAAECCRVLPEIVLAFLERLDWPGNVRQLQTVIARSCAIGKLPEDLTIDLFQRSALEDGAAVVISNGTGSDFEPLRNGETFEMRIDAEERKHVIYALELCKGNRTHAAAALGISRQWLLARIKKFDL